MKKNDYGDKESEKEYEKEYEKEKEKEKKNDRILLYSILVFNLIFFAYVIHLILRILPFSGNFKDLGYVIQFIIYI